MARRVLLHVGCPKTGTSFLQGVLWSNRAVFERQGLCIPKSLHHHYRASLYIRDVWQQRPAAKAIESDWHELVQAVQESDQDVLISHELFAAATREQAKVAIEAFGGAETHVIVTARDLARQLPAEWQQSVKQGSTRRLDTFLGEVMEEAAGARWFWRVQDLPDVVRRWGATLPAERVHLVTVPPRGADPAKLWSRFTSVIGVEPGLADLQQTRSNESLGAVEVELLRRLNEGRGDRFPILGNHRWFKDLMANQILAQREDKKKFVVSADAHGWICDRSRQMIDETRGLDCNVVGDLNDLDPEPQPERGWDPGQASDEELLEAATGTLLDLLDVHRGVARRGEQWRTLAQEREQRVAELEDELTQRTARRVVRDAVVARLRSLRRRAGGDAV